MSALTRSPFRSFAFYAGLAQAVLCCVLGVVLTNVVLRVTRLFEEFDMDLPDTTIAVIGVATLLVDYWYLAVVPVCLWPFVNERIVRWLSPAPGHVPIFKWLWYSMTWSMPCLVAGTVTAALLDPLVFFGGRLS